MIKVFCDKCGKEITDHANAVPKRATDGRGAVLFDCGTDLYCDECMKDDLTCGFKVGGTVITSAGKEKMIMKEMTLKEIQKALGYEVKVVAEKPRKKFDGIEIGEIITVADTDFIVLDKTDDEAICLTKDFVYTDTQFDNNTNNYANSSIRKKSNKKFAQKLIDEVGKRGLCDIELDLLSLDGLDEYGTVTDKVGLLTVDMYRKYNRIIEMYLVKDWWWLATPWSTPHRGYNSSVCGVSYDGAVDGSYCHYHGGVRPFCIFSSSIF